MVLALGALGLRPPYLLPQNVTWDRGSVLTAQIGITPDLVEGHFRTRPLVPLLVFSRAMLQTALTFAAMQEEGRTAIFESAKAARSHQKAFLQPPLDILCKAYLRNVDAERMGFTKIEAYVRTQKGWELYASLVDLTLKWKEQGLEETPSDTDGWEAVLIDQLSAGYQLKERLDTQGIMNILQEGPPFLRLDEARILHNPDKGTWRAIGISSIPESDCEGHRDNSIPVPVLCREQAITAELLAAYTQPGHVPIAARTKRIEAVPENLPPGRLVSTADSSGKVLGNILKIQKTAAFRGDARVSSMTDTIYLLLETEAFLRRE